MKRQAILVLFCVIVIVAMLLLGRGGEQSRYRIVKRDGREFVIDQNTGRVYLLSQLYKQHVPSELQGDLPWAAQGYLSVDEALAAEKRDPTTDCFVSATSAPTH